jgi:phosphate transport system substrate-binding protein
MAMRYGKCANFGLCPKADARETQAVPDGADFACQNAECKRLLTGTHSASLGRSGSNRTALFVSAAVLVIAGVAASFRFAGVSGRPGATVATVRPPMSAPPLLRLSGSNTIGAQLGPDLAEAWLGSRGATNLHREPIGADETRVYGLLDANPLAIEIRAHGSATAFSDLAKGACDIGMASRRIKSSEADDLKAKGLGDLTGNANERVIGLDGVTVIVNETNPTDSMTKDEVAAIFSGASEVRKWNLYARDDKSGTYDTFKDRVLGSRSLGGALRFEDSRALVTAVSRDPDGIGFVGLPYAVGVKVLKISDRGAMSMVPNAMTVRTEAYPLTRRLYLYVPDSAKPEARAFADFAISAAGQEVVERAGFVGQKVAVMPRETPPPDAPSAYTQLIPRADRLSVDLRFRPNNSVLDPKGVDDIKRIASVMSSQFSDRGIMLIGFADSTGTREYNLFLSKRRAQAVGDEMRQEGINPVLVTGFGQDLPVADNSTPEGKEKNRRVEVWLRK